MNKDLKNARILVIDDQLVNLELIRNLLEMDGYTQIKVLSDSREAIQTIIDYKPNLILLDIMMPFLSGFDILQLVEQKKLASEAMPIVVLTADNNFETKRKALSSGAKDFLTKPFDLLEISLRIKNLLSFVYLILQQRNQNSLLEEKVMERTSQLKIINNDLMESRMAAENNALKYRLLFNANKDAIMLFNIGENSLITNFINSNTAAVKLFGYSEKDFEEINIYNIGIDNVDKCYVNKILNLNIDESIDIELTINKKPNKKMILETKSVRLNLNENCTIMLIARDITERKKYLDTIENQNKSLLKVAFTQSHVVRAPVARIMGLASLIIDDTVKESSDFTKQDMINSILDSANELDSIIHNIIQITSDALTQSE
jgi:PAS domain S-box-containing protein